MKLFFQNDILDLRPGLELVAESFNLQEDDAGIPVEVIQNADSDELAIRFDGDKGVIEYTNPTTFYRLLNLWLFHAEKGNSFDITEKAYFDRTGVMVDASRNAVLSVDGMKELLNFMAKIGLNQVMLYTEDTYEVKERPYFGYLRGRYTEEELRALDDYAYALGIEMVPCIQTLGHLATALQYGVAKEIRDTHDILLVGEPKTYEFIEDLIRTVSNIFRTNKIHVGMDETFGLGRGVYEQKHGIRDNFEIMNEHLEEVVKITDKYHLEPMMWSDMFYRFGSVTGDYYDLESNIPQEVIDDIPDIDMVYWDYYHEDKGFYDTMFKNHLAMDKKVIFAGGIWTWNGMAPNYGKTFETTKPGLASAKENGLKEVFATMWGDDGSETPIFSQLPGLQLFADLSYRSEVDEDAMAAEFEYNTGYSLEKFMQLTKFDETPGVSENNLNTSATSKILLYQDPLLGRFDKNIEGLELNKHYADLANEIKDLVDAKKSLNPIFEFYHQLAVVLSEKAEFGLHAKDAYDKEDKVALQEVLEVAKGLVDATEKLRLAHRKAWMTHNKPFGWESIDIRYGGTIARMKSTVDILSDYLEGQTDIIAELEEEKIPYSSPHGDVDGQVGFGFYKDIVTTGRLSGL